MSTKRYRVMLVRATTEYTFVEVEAKDEGEAEKLADKRGQEPALDWEVSCDHEPHWVDDDSIEEIDDE